MIALMDYCERFGVNCGLPNGCSAADLSAVADEAVPMIIQAMDDSKAGFVEDGMCLYDHEAGKFLKGSQLL